MDVQAAMSHMGWKGTSMPSLRLLALILFTFAALTAGTNGTLGQSATTSTPESLDLDGLERQYSRVFTADITKVLATPEADAGSAILLATHVFEFESEGQAAAGMDQLFEQLDTGLAAENIHLDKAEINFDLEHIARCASNVSGIGVGICQVLGLDGNYLYAAIIAVLRTDPVPLIEQVMTMMREGEVSGEETFNADGTSTGGLWSKLPSVHEVTAMEPALTTVEDMIVSERT